MASRCDGVSRLGDSGPSHVLPAPQRPAEFKGLLIKNSPIVYNGKSKTVTRRSLAILHLPPLVALTVDGEPKSKPKAMPTMDCCKDGLMAAVKAAKPGDTILIPGGT